MADQGSSFIDWAKVIIGIVDLLVRITNTFEEKMLIDAGQAKAVADRLQKQADALKKAQAVRQSVRDALRSDPSSVMRDDAFLRPSKGPSDGSSSSK